MANGIAVNDNYLGVPPPRITTRQPYYPAPVGYYQLYNPANVVWETESLSTWSEWSDHDVPCCGCDCDCQPAVDDRNSDDRRRCNTHNRHSTVSDHTEGFCMDFTDLWRSYHWHSLFPTYRTTELFPSWFHL